MSDCSTARVPPVRGFGILFRPTGELRICSHQVPSRLRQTWLVRFAVEANRRPNTLFVCAHTLKSCSRAKKHIHNVFAPCNPLRVKERKHKETNHPKATFEHILTCLAWVGRAPRPSRWAPRPTPNSTVHPLSATSYPCGSVSPMIASSRKEHGIKGDMNQSRREGGSSGSTLISTEKDPLWYKKAIIY